MTKAVGGRKRVSKYVRDTYGQIIDNEEAAKEFLISVHEDERSTVALLRLKLSDFEGMSLWQKIKEHFRGR